MFDSSSISELLEQHIDALEAISELLNKLVKAA
jgi:hypothetical protein